jgi:hypothetical protein
VTEPCENVPYLSGSNPEGQPVRVSVVVRAFLVSERVGVILDASVPEKAVGTDLSDGLPVLQTVLCCSEKAGEGSLNLTKHALRGALLAWRFLQPDGHL